MEDVVNTYHVRAYREGDEREIVGLFNRVFESHAGFVPRTIDYWRWCCLDRPDVEREGIIVVAQEEKIVGYGVVGRSGNILELCSSRDCDERYATSLVLQKAVDYLNRTGAGSATLNLPCSDSVSREVCRELGFTEIPSETLFLGALDLQNFLNLLVRDKREKLADFDESILILLSSAPSWIDSQVFVNMQDALMQKESEVPHPISIETDVVTLLSVLFGSMKPLKALLSLRLKIRPLRKISRVLKLLSILRIRDPWFFPLADFG